MRITRLETFLANGGLRNYLFVRLTTDTGLSGLGEATLEWQERAVQLLIEDWLAPKILGADPFDVEQVVGGLIRDQYQGGSTVLTAISGVEIALWDLIGKACGQPVYKLLGGRAHERLAAYANGWYGGANTPEEYACKASDVAARGYTAMKFDPFATAWKFLSADDMQSAEAIVAAVRRAVGDRIELMIEVHGRLAVEPAIEMAGRLATFRPRWYEEPVTPNSLDLLAEAKRRIPIPIAAGERLYMLEDFFRLSALRACDVVQMDIAHCGGLGIAKKIGAFCQAQDQQIAPHCSIGPVALAAAVHFGWATPNVVYQENFADFDVPWRHALVSGHIECKDGYYELPQRPGLGVELNEAACAQHPYQSGSFPSLWDRRWIAEFTKNQPE